MRSSGDIALLQQHDDFFDMLTAREVLVLATFLQLNMDHKEQKDLVDHIMDSLGLRHVESNRIGSQAGSASGRLSGGERRRLSIGTWACPSFANIQTYDLCSLVISNFCIIFSIRIGFNPTNFYSR